MQVSWCKLEVEVATPKSVMMPSAEGQPQDVPPLVVAALNLKTRFNAQVPASITTSNEQTTSHARLHGTILSCGTDHSC